MPRDANGTYTLPIAPFQPLTLAKSADMNTALTDIADALTDSQSRASPTPAQGDLNLNGHNILNLGEVVGDAIATGGVYANGPGSGFGFALEAPNYVWHWGVANYFDWFSPLTSMRYWRAAGADVMTLDASGNLHANGTISAGGAISTPSNISASGNASIGGTVTANIVNANGITSYGNLTVSGNASIGGTVTASGTVTGGYVTSTGNVNAAGTLTGGALNIGGGTITAGQINASGSVAASGNVSCQGVYASGGLFQIAPNYYLARSGSDGAWRFVENGTSNLSIDASGNTTVRGILYAAAATISGALTAPRLTGGEGGAGALQCYGSTHAVTFNWGPYGGGTWLSYRVDGAVDYIICTSVNAQSLQMATGGGGPTNTFLAVNDNGGNAYYIQADVLSDARIKHSIAPSQIDALALLDQVEVVEFHVRADAVAAIQPVSPEQKAALREAPDPFVPIGLVAQQVRPFLPEMVTIQPQPEGQPALPDDLHGLHLAAAVPYLVRAVQQLSARVAALEAAAGH